MDLKLKINNPNRYPVAFQNLMLDIYDMNGVHIGQASYSRALLDTCMDEFVRVFMPTRVLME